MLAKEEQARLKTPLQSEYEFYLLRWRPQRHPLLARPATVRVLKGWQTVYKIQVQRNTILQAQKHQNQDSSTHECVATCDSLREGHWMFQHRKLINFFHSSGPNSVYNNSEFD